MANNIIILDSSKKLHLNHSFTVGWLIKSLQENDEIYQTLHKTKVVKDVTASDISNGKGFISIVLQCIVSFFDSDECYSTILKIPGFQSFIEAQKSSDTEEFEVSEGIKIQFTKIHESECKFYNEISSIFDSSILPKIHKIEKWILEKQEGCIHMEDLTLRGKTLENFDRLNLAQIKSFVQNLAKIHKNILSADPRLWKGKYLSGQTALIGCIEYFNPDYVAFLKNCNFKDRFKPLLERYSKFMINCDYYRYIQTQSYKDLNIAPVIVHGDISIGNLMFVFDGNKIQNEISAIIDWQLMHEGSPMEDLAKLLTHFCDGNIRRKAETFIFEYYLECLKNEYFEDDAILPYSLEQIKAAYSYSFITQTFFAVFGVIQNRCKNDDNEIKKAFYDSEVLKCLHALKDVDLILQNEFKAFFDKYNY